MINDIKPIRQDAADDFAGLNILTLDDIFKAFGIPPSMIPAAKARVNARLADYYRHKYFNKWTEGN